MDISDGSHPSIGIGRIGACAHIQPTSSSLVGNRIVHFSRIPSYRHMGSATSAVDVERRMQGRCNGLQTGIGRQRDAGKKARRGTLENSSALRLRVSE